MDKVWGLFGMDNTEPEEENPYENMIDDENQEEEETEEKEYGEEEKIAKLLICKLHNK